MPADFDPYYTWLGIPPEEQPPNHYRLLGIRPLETNRDVIAHAMDQRMIYLRSMQTGQHSAESQRLLNEVSAAAVVLFDAERKAAYDAALRQRLETLAPPVPTPAAAAPPAPPMPDAPAPAPMQQLTWLPAIVGAGCLAATVTLIAAVMFFRAWNGPTTVASKEPEPRADVRQDPAREMPAEPPVEPERDPDPILEVPAREQRRALASTSATPAVPQPAATAPENPRVEPEPPPSPSPTPTPMPPAPPAAEPDAAKAESAPKVEEPPAEEPAVEVLPAQEEIDKAIAELNHNLSAARPASTKSVKHFWARDLVATRSQPGHDAAKRYAMLDMARKLFAEAGDIDLALLTCEQQAERYGLPRRDLQVDTLTAASEASLSAEERQYVSAVLLLAVDGAVQEENLAAAEKFARLATKVSSRAGDPALRRSVTQKRSELERLKDYARQVAAAREKLAKEADPTAEHLLVGKYLCFLLGNFEDGLPHLTQSGASLLSEAAASDIEAESGDVDKLVAAADDWFEVAQSQRIDKEMRPGAFYRARMRYQQALPLIEGFDKLRVQQRIEDCDAVAPLPRIPVRDAAKVVAKKDRKKGTKSPTSAGGSSNSDGTPE